MAFFNALRTYVYKEYYENLQQRNALSIDLNQHQNNIVNQVQSNGICIVPGYLDGDTCNEIVQSIDQINADYAPKIWRDQLDSDKRIWGGDRLNEGLKSFAEDEFLHRICEGYLGAECENLVNMAGKLEYKQANKGSGGGWHMDVVLMQQFKAIVYLTDVEPNNGPFQFIPNSHNKENLQRAVKELGFGFNQNRLSAADIENYCTHFDIEPIEVTGKKGTLILVDTSGIHRGAPIQNGLRYALTNYYYPKYIINEKLRNKFGQLRV